MSIVRAFKYANYRFVQSMKISLQEPFFAKYLSIDTDNTVHVFMPVVSGTEIGLDKTCKAVYSLQEFFGKGGNSNKKATIHAIENHLEPIPSFREVLSVAKESYSAVHFCQRQLFRSCRAGVILLI